MSRKTTPYPRPPVWVRAWNRIVETFNERFRRWNYVFVFDPTSRARPGPPGLRFERYEREEEVPESVRDVILRHADRQTLEWDLRELRDRGICWYAYLGRELVAKQLIRRGKYFRRWFVPLESCDLVLFRGWARPDFRGRGIVAALIRKVLAEELQAGGRAYTDCRVFNTSSRRMIEKAGFRWIATIRTLNRDKALILPGSV